MDSVHIAMPQRSGRKDLFALYERHGKKVAAAISSEAILSVSNLVLAVALARSGAKVEYASYVILFSLLGIIGGYHNALISAPLLVLIHTKPKEEHRSYVSGLAAAATLISGCGLALTFVLSLMYAWWSTGVDDYIGRVGTLCVAAFIFLIRDFIRTLKFVTLDVRAVFRMDLTHVVSAFCCVTFVAAFTTLSAAWVLFALALGYFVSSARESSMVREWLTDPRGRIRSAFMENWRYGKWAVLGSTWSFARDRGYIYIVSALLGLGALADVAAARLFFMPIGMLNLGVTRIFLAKASQFTALNRHDELRHLLVALVVGVLLIWTVYFAALLAGADALVRRGLGEQYVEAGKLLPLWGAFFALYTVRYQTSTALVALRRFRALADVDLVATVVSLAACAVLTFLMGRSGAVVALVIGEGVSALLCVRLYRSTHRIDGTVGVRV